MFVLIKKLALFPIYITGIIILFLVLTGRVKYGLMYLVPLFPLQNLFLKLRQLPLGKDINDILLIAMIIGWFVYKASRGESFFSKSAFNKILFFYIIYTYFTLWRGSLFLGLPLPITLVDSRLQNWKNYIILPLLFLLTLNNTKDKKEIKTLFIVLCLVIFYMNFSTIREARWLTAWWNRFKIHGTFVWLGVNELAAFYATYTFVILGIFLYIKERILKLILGVLTCLNAYCILFTFSRGAYLATLIGLFIIAFFRNKKLIIPLIIILILWQTVLPKDVVERIQFTEQEEGQLDPSAAQRIEYWQQAIEYFTVSPIIGIGFNVMTELGAKRDTHNLYLRTLAEQGIIGLGFLLIIMFLALKKSYRLYKNANDNFLKGLGLGFFACTLAMITGNFFGDRWTYLPLGAYFWVFLGMVERGNIIAGNELAGLRVKKIKQG